ncbi:hypothetical protein KIN20_031986 [Parelaphostrongylus tenuis]|uniref:3-dehydrosphinganine reductase n=1 Tax=Parelaphostrongylus tenuis TaxID=148309 RepID=A0AAD5WH66_PARTN|nr:hypothetical protein KIN20_031986 [Parelaphostrongylus tenuis]
MIITPVQVLIKAGVNGGSKGIGKQIAFALVSKGCNVSIIARNEADLKTACEDLQLAADQRNEQQKVRWYSLDVTKSYEEFESVIRRAEAELGSVDVLINNVGMSVQAAFDELPISSFEDQTRINYLSAVYATRCVVGGMKARRSGHISFVSSAAGQCAIWGYTAYAPTKFAIRGFADALQMELSPYNINVSVLYPPNTDTEGFKVEMETMPEEVRLISGTAGFFSPQDVAKAHVQDIEDGQYATAVGLDGWMLCVLTAGASPERSMFRLLPQVLLGGLLRGVILIYLGYFNGIVKKCYRRRRAEIQKAEVGFVNNVENIEERKAHVTSLENLSQKQIVEKET